MLHYALFNAHPNSNPPFVLNLGFKDQVIQLEDCQNIPDGVLRIVQYCKENNIEFSKQFTLLYPIYMEVMNTDTESTMHQIAWLIKDEADAKGWVFNRIGGLTNMTEADFLKS